jgi:CRP-like cAMP-binding protein
MAATRSKKGVKGAAPTDFDIRSLLTTAGDECSRALYGAKQTIFSQGDPADAVFYIEKGSVQLCVVSQQGKEAVIAMLGQGEFFGEGCLTGQTTYLSTAIAMAPSELLKIRKATMVRALHEQPGLAELFTSYLLSRNIQIEADLVDQLFNSSEKRLARALLFLANFGTDGNRDMVIPKVNQDVLAARVGTTRSRINFFMNKFRKLGFIEYNGHLKVNSSLLNVIIHDASDAPEARKNLGSKRGAEKSTTTKKTVAVK